MLDNKEFTFLVAYMTPATRTESKTRFRRSGLILEIFVHFVK